MPHKGSCCLLISWVLTHSLRMSKVGLKLSMIRSICSILVPRESRCILGVSILPQAKINDITLLNKQSCALDAWLLLLDQNKANAHVLDLFWRILTSQIRHPQDTTRERRHSWQTDKKWILGSGSGCWEQEVNLDLEMDAESEKRMLEARSRSWCDKVCQVKVH